MGRKAPGPEQGVAELPNQTMRKVNHKFCITLIVILAVSLLSVHIVKAEEIANFDSLIVKPTEKVKKLRRKNRLMHRQGIIKFKKINENAYLVPLDADSSNEEKLSKIKELKKSGLFDLVEPDYKISLDQIQEKNYITVTKHSSFINNSVVGSDEDVQDITTNDSDFKAQYYLKEINVTKAWNGIDWKDSVLVGVLDTGINANHADLENRIIGDDAFDDIGHGTEVAGIIAANTNNNQGIAGLSWNTRVVSLKVTDENGQARVSTVVSQLEKAYQSGVKVVQISLSTNQFSFTLRDAIKLAQDRGILIVTSAGNSGINELRYPAAFDGVIGVGAVGRNKTLETYSTTGEHVSLVAPGSAIHTTSNNGDYTEVTGTSFAAPQVSGIAALLFSIEPDLTAEDVRKILLLSADDLGDVGKDQSYGYGLLNARKAVDMAKTYSK